MIRIEVSNDIKIYGLPEEWEESLAALVSIPNEAKRRAIKEHVYGAKNMPDRLTALEKEDSALVAPRGFKNQLVSRLKKADQKFIIDDKSVDNSCLIDFNKNINLRDLQTKAYEQILDNKQGLVMASPGFGKTTVGLYTICSLQKKSIILIDKTELAKQWIDRASEQFNLSLGLIGDNEWEEKDITVATLQTLRSKEEELDEINFWNKWSVVFYDESHHASSETYYKIINKFPAKYRIGLSATKGKTPAKEKISELIFGEVIFEDKTNNLKPNIVKVPTDFYFDYQPTSKIGNKVIRNNYQKLISSLIENSERNNLIAKLICKDPNSAHLIISRRLKHLEDIHNSVIAAGFDSKRCFMLTGKEPSDERLRIAKLADEGSIAIFSTVADEGLDIPRLDRIHLVFPSKNHETIRQQVGRGLRNHDAKQETIVYDYVDIKIGVSKNQWRNRMNKYYKPNDFPISTYKLETNI